MRFGESYVKLPPITGKNAVEIDDENSKRISSGVGRDQRGLLSDYLRSFVLIRFDLRRQLQRFLRTHKVKTRQKCQHKEQI